MITKLASTDSTFRRRQRQLSDNQHADIGPMLSDLDGFMRRPIGLG